MGHFEKSKLIVNWAGSITSPKFGQEAIISTQLSSWNLNQDDGFRSMNYAGDSLPSGGGYFINLPGNNWILYITTEGIYKFECV
jgi:hypothetical protein